MSAALTRLDVALASSEVRQREFLLSISHDLRTPLTALRGYAEALRDGAIPAGDVAEVGATLTRGDRRLASFITDLLALARLEADDFRLQPGQVDVADVIDQAAAAWRATATAHAITLTVALPDDLQPFTGDAMRIRQLLDGLVENAMRATPERRPRPAEGRPGRRRDGDLGDRHRTGSRAGRPRARLRSGLPARAVRRPPRRRHRPGTLDRPAPGPADGWDIAGAARRRGRHRDHAPGRTPDGGADRVVASGPMKLAALGVVTVGLGVGFGVPGLIGVGLSLDGAGPGRPRARQARRRAACGAEDAQRGPRRWRTGQQPGRRRTDVRARNPADAGHRTPLVGRGTVRHRDRCRACRRGAGSRSPSVVSTSSSW